jgi:hypothetical protein
MSIDARPIVLPSLPAAVDLYWMAQIYIQNALEDIEGADGRVEYLHGLRYRLAGALQFVDSAAWPHDRLIPDEHRAAFALDHGVRFLGLNGADLAERLLMHEATPSPEDLGRALADLCRSALEMLPGRIPAAQGPQGQREVLRAMRNWSQAAEQTGDDLGFLAERLEEL